jgi:hypothetical protein
MAANCEKFFTSYLEFSKIRADMKDFLVARLNTSLDPNGASVGVGEGE